MNQSNKTYDVSVIDMHDYGASCGHRKVEGLDKALSVAKGVVIGSVDWDAPGCKYSQWCSFGEDAIVSSSDCIEAIQFSGAQLVREHCNCEMCQASLERQ